MNGYTSPAELAEQRVPFAPSWLAPDDGRIRDEYTAGHGPCQYLDACRRRDVREQVRATGARLLRLARLLPDDERRAVIACSA